MRTDHLSCTEIRDYLLTHEVTAAGPIPTAFDSDGVYPYVSYTETARRPVLKEYRFIVLENAKLKVTISPDLGGRIRSIVHKASSREVLYCPAVIRPVRILPRFAFVAGGIEPSFPISHSPTQNEHVLCEIHRTARHVYVTCGERELRFGLQWSVEYSLGADDDFLTQRTVFHNPGQASRPWMSWSNAALPCAPDTEFHFPNGEVLAHSSELRILDWQRAGPRRQSDIQEMTGYFWQTKDANAFGAFTPSLGIGLYHVADERLAPGLKLWSYGVGEDHAWATSSAARLDPYIEIQGGPVSDQSVKREIGPRETLWHLEFWIPSAEALDIYSLEVPDVQLRALNEVPLFEWARQAEVKVWIDLLGAYEHKAPVPEPPAVHECRWAPSGMEDMDDAFDWAIQQTDGETTALWTFHYGSWLAGTGRKREAMRVLSASDLGVAKVLLARLMTLEGDVEAAAATLRSVQEQWLQLHPQIVVERDEVLRRLGPRTLEEREQWLREVDALQDEWIIERRVQYLMDRGELQSAKELLLSSPFQKVHQRYMRTELWKQLCERSNEPCRQIPAELGEDHLAVFGAYREFAIAGSSRYDTLPID